MGVHGSLRKLEIWGVADPRNMFLPTSYLPTFVALGQTVRAYVEIRQIN